jgi:hypothetical protein
MPSRKIDFSRAVFSDDNRDRTIEIEREIVLQKRPAKRIGTRISHAAGIEPYALEVRRRQIDLTLICLAIVD